MTLDPAVAATRVAVRGALEGLALGPVAVACSGGADSLALAAALAFEGTKAGRVVTAVTVDHGWGTTYGSEALEQLGLPQVVIRVEDVRRTETSARELRYEALGKHAAETGAAAVLLGHTGDDQAEQVLLGLARGSGTRSLAGIPPARGVYRRPFLGLTRAITQAACDAQGLAFVEDPSNADRKHARARVRHDVLPVLEQHLGPGVSEALRRTAELARDDADALDALAAAYDGGLDVTALSGLAKAVLRRVLKAELEAIGCVATAEHLLETQRLITDWHGQGPLMLPGGVKVRRSGGRIELSAPAPEGIPNGE
jgi:tRNA(Ile)-lysidine synthase